MDDLTSIFEMTVPVWEAMLRGTLIYLGVVILIRIVGQRETGSLSIPDLILIVLISEAVSTASPPMTIPSPPARFSC